MGKRKHEIPQSLNDAAVFARGRIPDRLINGALTIAQLELKENSNCPVPDALASALIDAANNKPGILARLVQALDSRSKHFNTPI